MLNLHTIVPLAAPKVRRELAKTIKHRIGVIHAWRGADKKVSILYWGKDDSRKDSTKSEAFQPISSYWNGLYKEMFSNW